MATCNKYLLFYSYPGFIILPFSINALSCYEELFLFSWDLAASNGNHINDSGLN